jgi:hypothetical protein
MLLHTVTTELLLASELVLGLTAQLLLLMHMTLPVKHMTLPVLGLTAHLMVLKPTTLPGLTAQLLHTTLLNLTAQLLRTALLNLTAQLPNITPLTLQLRQPLLLLLPILLFSPHFHTNFHHRPSTNGKSFHADTHPHEATRFRTTKEAISRQAERQRSEAKHMSAVHRRVEAKHKCAVHRSVEAERQRDSVVRQMCPGARRHPLRLGQVQKRVHCCVPCAVRSRWSRHSKSGVNVDRGSCDSAVRQVLGAELGAAPAIRRARSSSGR